MGEYIEGDVNFIITQSSLAKEILDIFELNQYSKKTKDKTIAVIPRPGKENEEAKRTINVINKYINDYEINEINEIKCLIFSICKFLGDTSHLVMAYNLLDAINTIPKPILNKFNITGDSFNTIKVNLQLSERVMAIRSCLFPINVDLTKKLIVWIKALPVFNKLYIY